MTPDALRAELARLGLSQLELARRTGANARTVRRWLDPRSGPLAPGAAARVALALRTDRPHSDHAPAL
jgi:transcriptional regulator with XRE-family HTH domain